VAGEDDVCSTTSLPPLNKVPSGFDHSKNFLTSTGHLRKPGSLNVVPGPASSPALIICACWPMLHWSGKQIIQGSLAAFKLEVNNLSGAPNSGLKAALCNTANAAAAELEEAALPADTARTAKAPPECGSPC